MIDYSKKQVNKQLKILVSDEEIFYLIFGFHQNRTKKMPV